MGCDIAVDHIEWHAIRVFFVVGIVEGTTYANADGDCKFHRDRHIQRTSDLDDACKVDPVDVFHRDEMLTVDFADVTAPIELALAQEKRVSEQIFNLTKIAREENDFAAEQFMQWFIKEQVEEVSTMNDLLTVVTRAKDDIEAIEEYVKREQGAAGADPTAPPMAGAGA